jgi:hypothetical protein
MTALRSEFLLSVTLAAASADARAKMLICLFENKLMVATSSQGQCAAACLPTTVESYG